MSETPEKELRAAMVFALKRLSAKAYLSQDLRKLLLKQDQFTEEITDEVIKEMTRLGYLNDKEWISGFVRGHQRKGQGPKMIAMKLQAKGIAKEAYQPFLNTDNELQQKEILRLLKKKYKDRDFQDPKEKQKVMAALYRKGFESEVISKSVELFISQ